MVSLSDLWRRTGPYRATAGLACRILWNTVLTHLEKWRLHLFKVTYRAPQESPEIQRLQASAFTDAKVVAVVASGIAEATVARAEILAEILVFCPISDVGRCTAVSHDFLRGASRDDLWCQLCWLRWRKRQHSIHMRRWLGTANEYPTPEDLYTDYSTEEQMLQCKAAAQIPWVDAPRPCRVASWRDRYIFAERDAKRAMITREELCWDAPCACFRPPHALDMDQLVEEEEGDDKPQRRWAVTLHFAHSIDLECFFHHDGNFFDTQKFRDCPARWDFAHGPRGEVLIVISGIPMELPPFCVERSADWGWRLISTERFAGLFRISSRQLNPLEQVAASRTPTEIVTLFMRRLSQETHLGPIGTWRCFCAYQGTMPGPSWVGRPLTIEQTSLTISLSDRTQVTYQCDIDEIASTIDVIERQDREFGDEDLRGAVQRGVYQLEAAGQVLVATRNELPGGPRPTGPPAGLPPIEEILRQAMADDVLQADVSDARANVVHM